jgi:hypothetical protein
LHIYIYIYSSTSHEYLLSCVQSELRSSFTIGFIVCTGLVLCGCITASPELGRWCLYWCVWWMHWR